MLRHRTFYRRRLPHFQPPGATLFITFRLAGSLPRVLIKDLMAERQNRAKLLEQLADPGEQAQQAYRDERLLFGHWDAALHTSGQGPRWLADRRIANVMADSLHYRDDQVYTLYTFCIMPNHVHLVCTPLKKAKW
jgi:hypothetical protein